MLFLKPRCRVRLALPVSPGRLDPLDHKAPSAPKGGHPDRKDRSALREPPESRGHKARPVRLALLAPLVLLAPKVSKAIKARRARLARRARKAFREFRASPEPLGRLGHPVQKDQPDHKAPPAPAERRARLAQQVRRGRQVHRGSAASPAFRESRACLVRLVLLDLPGLKAIPVCKGCPGRKVHKASLGRKG